MWKLAKTKMLAEVVVATDVLLVEDAMAEATEDVTTNHVVTDVRLVLVVILETVVTVEVLVVMQNRQDVQTELTKRNLKRHIQDVRAHLLKPLAQTDQDVQDVKINQHIKIPQAQKLGEFFV